MGKPEKNWGGVRMHSEYKPDSNDPLVNFYISVENYHVS